MKKKTKKTKKEKIEVSKEFLENLKQQVETLEQEKEIKIKEIQTLKQASGIDTATDFLPDDEQVIFDEDTKNLVENIMKFAKPEEKISVIKTLVAAFQNGADVKDACIYAGISTNRYYSYLTTFPALRKVVEKATLSPIFLAKNTLINAMKKGDTRSAQFWLERRKKDEFSQRQELTGEGGKDLFKAVVVPDKVRERLESKLNSNVIDV